MAMNGVDEERRVPPAPNVFALLALCSRMQDTFTFVCFTDPHPYPAHDESYVSSLVHAQSSENKHSVSETNRLPNMLGHEGRLVPSDYYRVQAILVDRHSLPTS